LDLVVTFPGNKKVDASYKNFTIHTDQPAISGGDGTAPAPFDLFLASIATCSGIYVVYFCEKRSIPFEDIKIVMRMERDAESRMIEKIGIDIEVPADFPEKYHAGLVRAVDLCAVKKHIVNAPAFEIRTVTAP
jgi:ribosomal protein S12 methylthiotransferase accessory factor